MIYDFAAQREFNLTLAETTRNTTLQENLISAAKDAELQDRPIVKSAHMIMEKKLHNMAIRSRHEIQWLINIQKVYHSKLEDYDKYPYTTQLGFIQAIPEEDFDIATSTIIELTFFGLFPKHIFQVLCRYELELKRFNSPEETEFRELFDNFIAAIISWPITTKNY
jgi:hypothetical protein